MVTTDYCSPNIITIIFVNYNHKTKNTDHEFVISSFFHYDVTASQYKLSVLGNECLFGSITSQ